MSSLWVVKKVKDGVTKWLDYDREEWSTVNASCRTSGEFWEGKMPCYGTVVEFVPRSELDEARRELERLSTWVNDLQSGMYVNCVYCGHRYGPQKDTPVTMADTLKAHIETCPKHPLSEALAGVARWNTLALGLASALCMAVGEEDTNENILAVVAEAEKGMNAALEAP